MKVLILFCFLWSVINCSHLIDIVNLPAPSWTEYHVLQPIGNNYGYIPGLQILTKQNSDENNENTSEDLNDNNSNNGSDESSSNQSSDGSYNFTYSTADSSRSESSDAQGNVEGNYAYRNNAGEHDLSYKANDETGFVVTGGSLAIPNGLLEKQESSSPSETSSPSESSGSSESSNSSESSSPSETSSPSESSGSSESSNSSESSSSSESTNPSESSSLSESANSSESSSSSESADPSTGNQENNQGADSESNDESDTTEKSNDGNGDKDKGGIKLLVSTPVEPINIDEENTSQAENNDTTVTPDERVDNSKSSSSDQTGSNENSLQYVPLLPSILIPGNNFGVIRLLPIH